MTTNFNRFDFDVPDQCVADCSHAGPCDEDVEFWMLKHEFAWPSDDAIKAELREYGAWDADQLDDVSQNRRRLLWIAAGNCKEQLITE